jgi:alginate O-acetyltransferase complex protein AlgI
MWFNSFSFLLFFALVLPAHWAIPSWRARKLFLLFASYFFYACWNPPFVALLILSSAVDYTSGRAIESSTSSTVRRLLVSLSCLVNFGILAFFKYSKFAIENFNWLLGAAGSGERIAMPDAIVNLLLPVGISFYTFHGVSYVVDVYRGRLPAVRSLRDFALFVSFFPQLVAGPILRGHYFLPQLEERRTLRLRAAIDAAFLILLGFFQKLVVADNVAPVANLVFENHSLMNTVELWTGTYAFALQIYFDFAGYSNIAIGTAALLGFSIPPNFNNPYASASFRELWRRWHISLSTWLRDYLYIPLGGNRKGTSRTLLNVAIVMFLGGLWHGPTWSFAVWGLLHGAYLGVEHLAAPAWERLPPPLRSSMLMRALGVVVTFHLTCIAWVFFRMQNLGDAWAMVQAMLLPAGAGTIGFALPEIGTAMLALVALAGGALLWRDQPVRLPRILYAPAAAIMLFLIVTGWGRANEFIYFRF